MKDGKVGFEWGIKDRERERETENQKCSICSHSPSNRSLTSRFDLTRSTLVHVFYIWTKKWNPYDTFLGCDAASSQSLYEFIRTRRSGPHANAIPAHFPSFFSSDQMICSVAKENPKTFLMSSTKFFRVISTFIIRGKKRAAYGKHIRPAGKESVMI